MKISGSVGKVGGRVCIYQQTYPPTNTHCSLVPKIVQLVSSGTGRTFTLRRTNMTTLSGATAPTISSIDIGDAMSNAVSADNILAYRPNFRDNHNSGLAAFFINLEAVFPCLVGIAGQNRYYPICRAFTNEEDGFRSGNSLLDTGDIGNGNFRIFSTSTDISTYAMAIQNCPVWTTACFPTIHSFSIVCYLPRNNCM